MQDQEFVRSFSFVLAILVSIAVGIGLVAFTITNLSFGGDNVDPRQQKIVEKQVTPVGQVAVKGDSEQPAQPKSGEALPLFKEAAPAEETPAKSEPAPKAEAQPAEKTVTAKVVAKETPNKAAPATKPEPAAAPAAKKEPAKPVVVAEKPAEPAKPAAAENQPAPAAKAEQKPAASHPAAAPSATPAPTPAPIAKGPHPGKSVYETGGCVACHAGALPMAPKVGDKAAWATRLQTNGGAAGLTTNAINGKGIMPPRGGNPTLTDQQLKDAVAYMLEASGAAQ